MNGSASLLQSGSDVVAPDDLAMKFFEKAMAKESHGLMSDAVEYYRKAFKLNENIDQEYRKHKVPHTVLKLQQLGGKNTAVRVDEEKVKQINVDQLLDSFELLAIATDTAEAHTEAHNSKHSGEHETFTRHTAEKNANEATEKESPLLHLPNDIWISILEILLIVHPESWFNYSMTCKKNSFLGLRSSLIWRKLANMIFPYQRYEENVMFQNALSVKNADLPIPLDQNLLVPQYDYLWKKMIASRPFVKFLGCYISVVNYYSEGGKQEFTNSWSNPVRLITYYRYLRFYPDGTCIKVLSHLEPNLVISTFLRKNKSITPDYEYAAHAGANATHSVSSSLSASNYAGITSSSAAQTSGSAANTAVSTSSSGSKASRKESQQIYRGNWVISAEGEVHVTITQGSVSAYDFHYIFQIKSLGPIFKHNKLGWVTYYSMKKEIDLATAEREICEFPLKNEKPFLFLRVRSYHEDTLEVIKA